MVDTDGTVRYSVTVSTGSDYHFALYGGYATDSTLTTWSAPTLLLSANGPIDPALVKKGATYYLWYIATGSNNAVCYSSASAWNGPYTAVGCPAAMGVQKEGVEVVQLADGSWRVYTDSRADRPNSIWYFDSADDWATWTAWCWARCR